MASAFASTPILDLITDFTSKNPVTEGYKMIIGLNKSDLELEERKDDNIRDVDVIINSHDESEIIDYNGKEIIILKIDFNNYSDIQLLKHFGTSITESTHRSIFGKFKEISFDWSTVKFIKKSSALSLLGILTVLLTKEGKLYVPNLNPGSYEIYNFNIESNIIKFNRDYVDLYSFDTTTKKISIHETTNLIIPSFIIKYNADQYMIEKDIIFNFNYDILEKFNFSVTT